MKCKIYTILILLPFWFCPAFCQTPDSLSNNTNVFPPENTNLSISTDTILTDSSIVKKKKRNFIGNLFSKDDYPNPQKALYLSLAIPGGGQIYNKRWWKLPFIYGGYVGLGIALDFNNRNFRRFRDALIAEIQGEEHELSALNLSQDDLRRLRDNHDKNRQLSYIGFVALHIIQTAEAFVDCHLKSFDVNDDLSLRVAPKVGALGDGSTYLGVGFTFALSD